MELVERSATVTPLYHQQGQYVHVFIGILYYYYTNVGKTCVWESAD